MNSVAISGATTGAVGAVVATTSKVIAHRASEGSMSALRSMAFMRAGVNTTLAGAALLGIATIAGTISNAKADFFS